MNKSTLALAAIGCAAALGGFAVGSLITISPAREFLRWPLAAVAIVALLSSAVIVLLV